MQFQSIHFTSPADSEPKTTQLLPGLLLMELCLLKSLVLSDLCRLSIARGRARSLEKPSASKKPQLILQEPGQGGFEGQRALVSLDISL